MSDARDKETGSAAHGTDPTKVTHQPALTTSAGTLWVVMGTLLLVVSSVPLIGLIALRSGPVRPVAIAAGVLMLAFTCVILVARFAVQRGPRRLRIMAASMIASAVVGVLGLLICLGIERG
ncbi:hypothetical protein [Leucobacter sp. NPDC077196]|uniref:hypothetical protein n=1 Tax=Leucobacter sp. NPDC077196 TaxID=3154959 RepID=UPI0034168FEE